MEGFWGQRHKEIPGRASPGDSLFHVTPLWTLVQEWAVRLREAQGGRGAISMDSEEAQTTT